MPRKNKAQAKKQINWKIADRTMEEEEDRDCHWDEPLPSSVSTMDEEQEEETEYSDAIEKKEQLCKLDMYVARMAYIPVPPPPPPKHIVRTEGLAKPKKYVMAHNVELFSEVFEPKERGERLKATVGFQTLSPEEFEKWHQMESERKRRRENIAKRKEVIYNELTAKLERKSRSQYLNALTKKFSEFVAHLATTMTIPPQLNEPYARMHRGIFYSIVSSLGLRPPNPAAYFYNTRDALEYETVHKCSHALLCLIIKALDAAAVKDPDEIQPTEKQPTMDVYIKERLKAAAAKKLEHIQAKNASKHQGLEALLTKCDRFAQGEPCVDV